ncbi:aminopeptidase N [Massilia glaciei]|uniref:Aminopeptidase N n=1 Tax=Massilia glaciei TaxID=1524097 RepID=A0A2U2HA32_9BURK|nr:aminopeptidase N [Massilia glaciei]PWF39537.1 aminopeptidase N [Massilia glaciei]
MHLPIRRPGAAALCAILALCAGAVFARADAPARAHNAHLSQADAAARSARVSNVDYALDISLSGAARFKGTSTIGFDLRDTAAPLTLDLENANITALLVNGKAVAPRYNRWFITLAPRHLRKGRNSVTVAYERAHSTNGEGLHRMVDPADGRVYTYSQFEPSAAHQMFALFDQPDLKASFTLSVSAPADWQVVSATRESAVRELGATRRWSFPKTPRLSPYTFSLHAGPYKVWEDNSGKYPLRLFARQSVAEQVRPADWFRYTKSGLAFFEGYFGVPYPFAKYDHLLVPDFLYGAMENVGAVTFSEDGFLFKSEMTPEQRENLASYIMHEMAHQWFGDLVTMQWWNGLWLNESFASFMGTLATAEATEFKGAWQTFYAGEKQGAYREDQSAATHPIEAPVASTANAFDNADGIVYAKGAAALKQLRHVLGAEVFRKGVHDYLVKHAYKTAKLEDFTGSLGAAAGRDLSTWTRQWLREAGVNTITANFRCEDGKVARFSIDQHAPNPGLPTLREQRVQVAAFTLDGARLTRGKLLALTYKGGSTPVPEMLGQACPDLVYPNYGDWGYAKVRLDARSFATARRGLGKVGDPFLRTMLWQSLWDGVLDAELPLNAFIDAALANAPHENDRTLLGAVVAKIGASRAYLDAIAPGSHHARKTGLAIEHMAWAGVLRHKSDGALLAHWFDLYLRTASSPEALGKLAAILGGRLAVGGETPNQDMRWAIIKQLNRHAAPGSAALVGVELARDKSDAGQAAALEADVMRPDAAVKGRWLARIGDPKTRMPFARLRAAMESLYPPGQGDLEEASADQRLRMLVDIDKSAELPFVRSYAETLIPATCTKASVARLAATLKRFPALSAGTRRALSDTLEEDARCVRIGAAMTLPAA